MPLLQFSMLYMLIHCIVDITGWYFNNGDTLSISNVIISIIIVLWLVHWKYAVNPSAQQHHYPYSEYTQHSHIIVVIIVIIIIIIVVCYCYDQPLPIYLTTIHSNRLIKSKLSLISILILKLPCFLLLLCSCYIINHKPNIAHAFL